MKTNKLYLFLLVISLIGNVLFATQFLSNNSTDQLNESMQQLGFNIGFYVKTIDDPNSKIPLTTTIDNLIIIANKNLDSELSNSILDEMDLVKNILVSESFSQETNQQQREAVAKLINTKFEESDLSGLTNDIESYLDSNE